MEWFILSLTSVGYKYYKGYKIPFSIRDSFECFSDKDFTKRFKILFIIKGTLSINYNNSKYIYSAPCILYLNEINKIKIIQQTNLEFKILLFHPNVINKRFKFSTKEEYENDFLITDTQDYYYVKPFFEEKGIQVVKVDSIQLNYLVSLLNRIHHILNIQDTPSWPCESRAYLIQILFYLSAFNHQKTIINNNPDMVEEICLYLQLHYNEPICLEQLCVTFKTNRTTINKKFKEKMDTTIIEYLSCIRLELANEMLSQTELSIKEISDRCGFEDSSYFSRFFKTKKGMTPSE